uniref:neuroblast differentiation-associated protein AHNAK-like n=1 Tax=Doryrhamphus excisus TaxID=161450 RepID=UPI0025AE3E03|nr:neuroblast differentiation-associated protein AHNAK-like [Doryrhamphus excisus]
MASHFNRRSLSDVLTLERSEQGALVISSIDDTDGTNQRLREGDEIVGATINFDHLSKEEVLGVLKLMSPYDDKIQVLTKNDMSKSLGHLDQVAVSPEMMLHDSYNKLYNAKIRRFMRKDLPDAEGLRDFVQTLPRSTKVRTKQDTDLPRLGVDFGRIEPKTLNRRFSAESDVDFSSGKFSQGANLNLPPLGVASNGAQVKGGRGVQVSQLLNARGRFVNVPSVDQRSRFDINGGHISGPSFDDLKMPDYSMGGPSGDAEWNVDTSPTMHLAGVSLESSTPHLDLNGPGYGPAELGVQTPRMRGDFSTPDVDLPSAQLHGIGMPTPVARTKVPAAKYKAPKFTMPKFDLPTVDVPNFEGPDFDMNAPKLNLNGPNADFDFDRKFKKPNMKLPNLELNPPKIDGPNLDLKTPGLDLNGGLNAPDLKIPKFKTPKLNMPDLHGPDLKLKTPKIKGGIDAPDLDLPNVDLNAPRLDLNAPRLDLNAPDINIGSPDAKFNMPKFKTKFGRPSLKGPDIDADQGMDINAPKFNGPNLDLKTPGLDLNGGLSAPDLKIPKFKTPKLNMPDLHGPDLKLKTPKMKGGIDAPDLDLPNVDLNAPRLDLNAPDINIGSPDAKFNMPKFKTKFGRPSLKGPDIDADLGMDINAPKFNGPNLDLKTPGLDLNGPNLSGGINTPDLKLPKFKTPKMNLKGPNLDLPDLHGPDLKLKTPKIKSGIDAPDFDLPKADLQAPKLDIKTPDLNIGSPKTKFKFPKFKLPKLRRPSLKAPELDADLDGPDLDINAPQLDLKGPNADFDIGGKLKKPNLKMPNFDLNGPNIDGPDLDLKGPNLSGGLNAPDLKLPKFKTPNMDLKGPNFALPSVDMPDLHSPDLKLKTPKIKGGIDAPDLDLPNMDYKTPKLDLNAPDINIGSPNAKINKPKFKLPKFRRPTLKGPDFDADLNGLNMDINAPKLNGPNLDLNTPDLDLQGPNLGGGINIPKLKTPNLDLPDLHGPDVNMDLKDPKLNLKTPDLNIGSPKTKFKFPKLKLPKLRRPSLKAPDFDADLDGPDLDIKAPELDLKSPNIDLDIDGKLKKPKINVPKLDGPNLDLKSPDLKMPKLDLKTPKLDLNAPKVDLNMPSGKVKIPKPDLSPPEWDVKVPSANIGSPKAKLKMPKFKVPKVNLPSLNGPDVDAPGFDINAPKMNLRGPKVPDVDFKTKYKKPHLSIPDVELSRPDLNGPDFNVKTPNLHGKLPKGNVDLNVGAPKMKGSFDPPRVDLPNMDLKAPQVDWDTPEAHLRKPHIRAPNMDLSGGLHGPDLRVPGVDIRGPNFKPKMPSLDIDDINDVNFPDHNMKFRAPDLDVDDPSLNFKKSLIGSSAIKLPGMGLDLDQDLPHPHMKGNMASFDDIDFTRSDLNIDDFTGKHHVPMSRGSKLDVKLPAPSGDLRTHGRGGLQLDADANLHALNASRIRAPDTSAEYLVTSFPTHQQIPNTVTHKYSTLGGLHFNSGDVSLDVPDQKDINGSNFLFSNLV